MLRVVRHALMPGLLVGWLVAAGPAAPAGEVKDDAGLFRPETVTRANEEIQELERQCGKQLVIHTVAGVPEGHDKAVSGMRRREKDKFFTDWAEERARDNHVDGVFVLVCKSPAYAKAVLSGDTDERLFPRDERDDLEKRLTPKAQGQGADPDLLEAIGHVRVTMRDNKNAAAAGPALSWPVVLGLIGGLFGLWLVILVVRAVLAAMGKLPAEPLHEGPPAPTPTAVPTPTPATPAPAVRAVPTLPHAGKLDETLPYPGPLPGTQPGDPLVTGPGRREDSVDF
jgi:hypothetical protein